MTPILSGRPGPMASTIDRPPSLDQWLSVAWPHLSLVDEPARSHLEAPARRLPASGLGVIEGRLAGNEREVDLSFRLTQPKQARKLARKLPWSHLRDLLFRWAEGEWRQVPTLWLEFDLDSDRDTPPPPLLIAQLPPELDPLWL